MNTTPTEEYFPSAEPRFNGGNGNGHTKAFSIKPATDPDTLAILDTRRRALADKRLNSSMQKLFCEVLDRSLNPTCRGFICKGVVAASDGTLSLHFGVSRRSIYTWKKGVEAVGYFWLSQKLMTNMEPITVYNITALRPQNERPVTDDDGVSQFGVLRRGWQNRPLGARKPGQPGLPLPGSRQAPPGAEIIDLQGISGETRRELPVSPEENFGSDPKKTSDETRRKLRVRPEENFRSHPKQTATIRETQRELEVLLRYTHTLRTEKKLRNYRSLNRWTGSVRPDSGQNWAKT